jgi:hypothetical protein
VKEKDENNDENKGQFNKYSNIKLPNDYSVLIAQKYRHTTRDSTLPSVQGERNPLAL